MTSTMQMPRRLIGDVALVTGSGRGIGRGIAIRLAAEGAAVGVLDLLSAESTQTVEMIERAGGRAISLTADVTSRTQISQAIEQVERELGPLTIAVNNAAICPTEAFLKIDETNWQAALSVNLIGPFIVGQEAARRMVERGEGRIVNISSSSARFATTFQSSYAASKAGLEALTRAMAFELGPLGIHVNCIAPGTHDTPLSKATIPEADRQRRIERTPLKRFGQPEDLAAAVAFLVSADAAFVQGVVLPVDGGYVMAGMNDGLIAR
jgi:NAD(P)-dependent dehydrogenase (short-subunit alcohol dehydrogenase family)